MHAYLVQHGKATTSAEDVQRRLTAEGREEVVRMARFLNSLLLSVTLIQHSGKPRAEETAHIFAEHLRTASGPSKLSGLEPTDDPVEIANFLNAYTDDILIVGHLPHLERLTSLLLTGEPDRRPVEFRHSGVTCLEKLENGAWSLQWYIVPDLLRNVTHLAA
jgi:phosphohistidine phosphatase